jgi:hypothetical protein
MRAFSRSCRKLSPESAWTLLIGCLWAVAVDMNIRSWGTPRNSFVPSFARVGTAGENEESVVAALSRDYFLLGDPAKNTTLAILNRCSHNIVSAPELAVFLESMWCLHQVEDTLATALPGSDSVRRFLRMYGS